MDAEKTTVTGVIVNGGSARTGEFAAGYSSSLLSSS